MDSAFATVADSAFGTVAGLPLHPLVVHIVVVLVPIAAIGAIIMAIWRRISRRVGSVIVLAAAAGAGASFVAKASGEAFTQVRGKPVMHAELGEMLPLIALALFLALFVFWLFDRGIPGNRPRPVWIRLFAVVLVGIAILAIVWTIRTGHTGAESVWGSVLG